jgi:hypothetical protein
MRYVHVVPAADAPSVPLYRWLQQQGAAMETQLRMAQAPKALGIYWPRHRRALAAQIVAFHPSTGRHLVRTHQRGLMMARSCIPPPPQIIIITIISPFHYMYYLNMGGCLYLCRCGTQRWALTRRCGYAWRRRCQSPMPKVGLHCA